MTHAHCRRLPAGLPAAHRAAFSCLVALAWSMTAAQAATPNEPAWATMPAPLLPVRLPVAQPRAPADANGWRLRAEAADFTAADAVPARDFSGDWADYHPRDGRNSALQSSRAELVASRQGWELAATARSDIVIQGSRGAFDVVHAYKQRATPADGSSYAADAQEQGVVWAGLRGARSWAVGPAPGPGATPALQLTAAVTLLSVRRVQLADVQGAVTYSDAAGYGFDARTQRSDSFKQFGGYGEVHSTGRGFTTDVGLLWQPSAALFVNLSAADVASRLRVQNLTTEATTLSSATRSTDAQGYLNYKPLATGRYSAGDGRLQLARKWSASAGWRLDGLNGGTSEGTAPAWLDGAVLGVRWEHIAGLNLPALWVTWPLAPGWALQLDAESHFRSMGVGLVSPMASLLLRSRSLPAAGSSVLGWQAALHWPW